MNEKQLIAAIGAAIRLRRKKAGLTISQLAELAGMDPGFLAYIETGKKMPSMLTAVRLANALSLSLSELLGGVHRAENDLDYRLRKQFDALFSGRSGAEKADLLAILKALRDPRKAKGLRQFIRR